MIPLDSFVGQSADGKMVPIIPGGSSIPLTFSNRKEYVERAIGYRLHEIDQQVRSDAQTLFNQTCHSTVCTEPRFHFKDSSLSFRLIFHIFHLVSDKLRLHLSHVDCCLSLKQTVKFQ